jgi:hypothetical protein
MMFELCQANSEMKFVYCEDEGAQIDAEKLRRLKKVKAKAIMGMQHLQN